jgi:GTP cyclohydrolase I
VARHWQAITVGLNQDPLIPLKTTFACDHDEIVLVRDIPVISLCEHHLLPVFGVAHVAYIPNGKVVGLSKLPRALEILARRPQLQERLNDQMAQAVQQALNPQGVAVVIKARHACMEYRGVMAHGAETITSSLRGLFKEDVAARNEVIKLMGL